MTVFGRHLGVKHFSGRDTVGRKRHVEVDTDARLPMVNLTPADISDSAGAQAILDAIRKHWPWLKHLFADGAYDRTQIMDKAAFLEFLIEIVRRIEAEPGFRVLPRRWVVSSKPSYGSLVGGASCAITSSASMTPRR